MPGGSYRQFILHAHLTKILTACSATGSYCVVAKAELYQSRNSRSCPLHNMHDSFSTRDYRGRSSSIRSTDPHEGCRPRRRDNRSRSPPRDRCIGHLHLLGGGVVHRSSCLGHPPIDHSCAQTKFMDWSVVQHGNARCSQGITSAVLPSPICHLLEPLPLGYVDRHCLQHW